MICTFFGHRSVPEKTEEVLRKTIIDMIENCSVDLFYVGNHGQFDHMVSRVLQELSEKYSIKYYVVLAYIPVGNSQIMYDEYINTILPDGIEFVPKRYAINYRNKWMIEQADCVVTYITNHIGSRAAVFKNIAERKGKKVIELGITDKL